MMNGRRSIWLVLTVVLGCSSLALAQEKAQKGFVNDPFTNTFWQSPAQLYQYKDPGAFAAFDYANGNSKFTYTGATEKVTLDGQGFAALGMFTPVEQATIGMKVEKIDVTQKLNDNISGVTSSMKATASNLNLAPTAAFRLGEELVLGVAFNIISVDKKIESRTANPSTTFNYSYLEPGLIYHNSAMELGLEFTPTININESGLTETDPAKIKFHAQFKAANNISAGGYLTYYRQNDIDTDNLKNNVELGLTAETMPKETLIVGGGFSYLMEAARKAENRDTGNISMMGFNAYSNYSVKPNTKLGGIVGYNFGSATASHKSGTTSISAKVSSSMLLAAVSASHLF